MAAPYAYQPFMVQTPYLWPYYQQQNHTPFIPPQQQLPPSPHIGGTRRVHFEDDNDVYYTGRPRPPSWHAGMAGTSPAPNPAPFPSPPIYVTPLPTVVPLPGPSVAPPTHHRRYSDGVLPQPAWVTVPTWVYPQAYPQVQPPPPAHQLNPLLNGEGGNKPPLIFDLSFYAFEPRRATSGHPSGKALSQEEYSQTATYPGVTRMVITCDEIPGLQVVLEPLRERPSNSGYLSVPRTDTTPVPPITVYDVLFAIHRKLQTQIRHRDWVALPQSKADAIARSYTRRCRTFPSVQQFEESQGVKWVDFLENKYMFRGLARHRAEPGFEHLRLLVSKP